MVISSGGVLNTCKMLQTQKDIIQNNDKRENTAFRAQSELDIAISWKQKKSSSMKEMCDTAVVKCLLAIR